MPEAIVMDVEPVPKRVWWLKRLTVLGVALVLALLGLRFWWGNVADKRLEAQIAAYRAAGELVSTAEIDAQLDAVPDEENRAVLYEAAMAKIVYSTTSGVGYGNFLNDRSLFDSDPDAATELFEANAKALSLVRQARSRSRIAWSMRLDNYFKNMSFGLWSNQRALGKMLWFAASYQLHAGNHVQAIETLQDSFDFSEDVGDHPTLISGLVGWACTGLAGSWIEDYAPDLDVEPLESGAAIRRDGVRARIRGLISTLLDETRSRAIWGRAWEGERLLAIENYLSVAKGIVPGMPGFRPSLWGRLTDFLQAPMLKLDTLQVMAHHTVTSIAARQSNWPAAIERFQSVPVSRSFVGRVSRPLSLIGFETRAYSLQLYFRYLAQRRMAAMALAIRLYVVDHGRRPAQLAELVPEYLSAVPLDPFSGEEATLRYRLEPGPAVLYSVGRNGMDNGGDWARRAGGGRDFDNGDILFYLDGRPDDASAKTSKGSSKAGKNNEDVEDAEGESAEKQPGQ